MQLARETGRREQMPEPETVKRNATESELGEGEGQVQRVGWARMAKAIAESDGIAKANAMILTIPSSTTQSLHLTSKHSSRRQSNKDSIFFGRGCSFERSQLAAVQDTEV